MAANHSHDDHHPSAFARLRQLLRPDAADIGVVIIFSLVVAVLNLAAPIAVEALVNTVAFGRFLQPLAILSLILVTFLGFAALLKGLQAYVAEVIQRRIFVRVVAELAQRLPRVKLQAFDGRDGSELMNRFFDVMTVQKTAALLVLDGVAIAVSSVIGMIVLGFYHPFLLGFDVGLMAAVAFVVFVLGQGAVATAVEESYKKYAVAAWLEQLAASPLAFKLGGAQLQAISRADDLAVDYVNARRKHFSIVLRQIGFALGLQAVAATALLGLGGWLVINQQLTLGQLVAAELIVAVIVGSFAKLGKHMESFYDLLAAVDKLGYLLDLPMERDTGYAPEASAKGASVRLHEVSLESHEESPALAHVDLHVNPGERVAICGAPGSGKSTLLELIFALREPTHGYVEFDGDDVRGLNPSQLREQVALIGEPEVFHGTIAENVHLQRVNITPRVVKEALEVVGLWEDVMRLPHGVDTPLVGRGSPLSRSQTVRLMLARAIAGKPRLLLIDGTLDYLADAALIPVFRGVCGREGERTVIIVTGRDVLSDECDRIFRLGPTSDDQSSPGDAPHESDPAPLPQVRRFAVGD